MRVDMNRTVTTAPPPAYVTGTLTLATGTTLYGRLFMYLDDDVVCPASLDSASYDSIKFFSPAALRRHVL